MDAIETLAQQGASTQPDQFSLAEMPVPLVLAEHRIIKQCNIEFASIFGYTADELHNTSFHLLYPKFADFVRTGEMWKSNFAGGLTYYDERVMRRADQTEFWCNVRGRSMKPTDPFAKAIYCFEPINRAVRPTVETLTDRQKQVLTLVAQGKTNAQIASEIGLSKRTIEAHRARTMKSIGVKNAAELVAWFSSENEVG
ncbi:LuxR C-terminal-related transcriptional regulator [Maritalea sp.]|uniref:PAS domain-containing protein n=1 Tax=Maritalea sp. TaxID=2003361 RepID=UPI003EF3BC5A